MENILSVLSDYYPIKFDHFEKMRDAGSVSYAVLSGNCKYFLRVIKPAFLDTAVMGAEIQVFLLSKGFPVPPVIFTKDNLPYIKSDNRLYILYEFIEGSESNPELDAEIIGAFIGKLHYTMKEYTGELKNQDKHFFIGRYIEILRKNQ